jgi:hypothetical protein
MKKLIALFTVAVMTLTAAALAQSKTKMTEVTRVKGSSALYKTELADEGDKSLDLSGGEEVTLLKQGKARSLIKTSGNIRGWVDNGNLERVKVSGGGAHNLKDVEVVGWLDNPSAVYILDNTNPDLNALPLDRSFASEINEKKDREEVERGFDEN